MSVHFGVALIFHPLYPTLLEPPGHVILFLFYVRVSKPSSWLALLSDIIYVYRLEEIVIIGDFTCKIVTQKKQNAKIRPKLNGKYLLEFNWVSLMQQIW